MSGTAGKSLTALTAEQPDDYAVMKKTFQARFRVTAESHCCIFRVAKKEIGETFREIVKLKICLSRCMDRARTDEKLEDRRDLFLQE